MSCHNITASIGVIENETLRQRNPTLPPSYVANYTVPTKVWGKRQFPCTTGVDDLWDNNPTKKGFLYTKPLKSASSTLAGIAIQTAYNMAKRRNINSTYCLVRWNHAPHAAKTMQYGDRIRSESFLWTFVREPTQRALSNFFFDEVSRLKKEPHDIILKNYLSSKSRRSHYIQEMSPDGGFVIKNTTVERIIDLYDYIGIVERFDESLIVLKLLLGLEYQDILYLSSKLSGGYDDGVSYRRGALGLEFDLTGENRKGTCVYIVPSFVSPGMQEWLKSDAWTKQIAGDNHLYSSVYRSLDLTIDQLGRELVAEQLKEFKRRLNIANEACRSRTIFPCSQVEFEHLTKILPVWLVILVVATIAIAS